MFQSATSNHQRRKRTGPTHARGVVLVEMAFVMPVLLLILVLAVDLSRLLIVTMALNNAAGQGLVAGSNSALNLSSTATWNDNITNTVNQSMSQYSWFEPSNLQVTVPTPSTANGLIDSSGFRSIEVTVAYHTKYILPWQHVSNSTNVTVTTRSDQVR